METTTGIESVTLSDIMNLSTWNRPRTSMELRSFVNERDDALDVEDFDL